MSIHEVTIQFETRKGIKTEVIKISGNSVSEVYAKAIAPVFPDQGFQINPALITNIQKIG